MKLNRKRVVTGLVATGLAAGALAGGGVALASTGAAPAPATSTSASPSYGPGSGHFGGMDSMGGMWSGQQPVMKAAADYLGLSLTQLHTQLQSGNSLADIADSTRQDRARPQERATRRHDQPHQRKHRTDRAAAGGNDQPGERPPRHDDQHGHAAFARHGHGLAHDRDGLADGRDVAIDPPAPCACPARARRQQAAPDRALLAWPGGAPPDNGDNDDGQVRPRNRRLGIRAHRTHHDLALGRR